MVAEPKSAKERDRELALALERSDTHGINTAEMAKFNSYDPETIYVYREGDLVRADRDIDEAATTTFLLVIYLDGLFRGRRKLPDGYRGISQSQLFDQLYGQRLFREVWDRRRAARQNTQQPPIGSASPRLGG